MKGLCPVEVYYARGMVIQNFKTFLTNYFLKMTPQMKFRIKNTIDINFCLI